MGQAIEDKHGVCDGNLKTDTTSNGRVKTVGSFLQLQSEVSVPAAAADTTDDAQSKPVANKKKPKKSKEEPVPMQVMRNQTVSIRCDDGWIFNSSLNTPVIKVNPDGTVSDTSDIPDPMEGNKNTDYYCIGRLYSDNTKLTSMGSKKAWQGGLFAAGAFELIVAFIASVMVLYCLFAFCDFVAVPTVKTMNYYIGGALISLLLTVVVQERDINITFVAYSMSRGVKARNFD